MRGIIENRCKCSQTQVFLWHKSEYIDFFFSYLDFVLQQGPSCSNANRHTEQKIVRRESHSPPLASS